MLWQAFKGTGAALRILILNWRDITHPQAGGAERFVHEIGKRLARHNEVTLFCGSYPGSKEEERIEGMKVVRAGGRFSVYIRALLNFKRGAYDIVLDDVNGIPFFSTLYSDAPVIPILHHIVGWKLFSRELPFPLSAIGWMCERSIPIFYRNRRFIVVSESTRQELMDELHVPPEDITVVNNGIDIDLTALQQKALFPTVAYVGRIKGYKRVEDIVRAFAKVHEWSTTAKLIIAGRGEMSALRELVERLGISDSVDFREGVDEDEKVRILSSAWVFVTASMKEGWGLSPLEANACGTPAISYDVPGLRDSIRDGYNGILVRNGDIDSLAMKIHIVISDNDLISKLSANGREWASRFTWDRAADDTRRIMEEVCGQDRRGVD
jgi:glycosyltransferase involved in cell wall biosynthesis